MTAENGILRNMWITLWQAGYAIQVWADQPHGVIEHLQYWPGHLLHEYKSYLLLAGFIAFCGVVLVGIVTTEPTSSSQQIRVPRRVIMGYYGLNQYGQCEDDDDDDE